MKWEMEVVSPSSYLSSSSWIGDSKSSKWTPEENKLFENALAIFDKESPDRWQKVAAMIPGKTVMDVIKQYQELVADVRSIEAGLIPLPGYDTSPFTLEWVNGNGYDDFKQGFSLGGKRSSSGRPVEHERKKGVPWTEEEHKLFLLGLKKYGKGDWRNISRNFVVTRTPTQVASHAQKYFIRQLSGGKDKRRASIHDITTVNLPDPIPLSPERKPTQIGQSSVRNQEQPSSTAMTRATFHWSQPSGGAAALSFHPTNGNMYLSSAFGTNPYEHKMQGQNLQRSAIHEAFGGPQNIVFQMQSAQHYSHD